MVDLGYAAQCIPLIVKICSYVSTFIALKDELHFTAFFLLSDLPSIPVASPIGKDPLVIAVIVIFVVTVGILSLLGFLRYRQHSSRLRFRRLQDLPMVSICVISWAFTHSVTFPLVLAFRRGGTNVTIQMCT